MHYTKCATNNIILWIPAMCKEQGHKDLYHKHNMLKSNVKSVSVSEAEDV